MGKWKVTKSRVTGGNQIKTRSGTGGKKTVCVLHVFESHTKRERGGGGEGGGTDR